MNTTTATASQSPPSEGSLAGARRWFAENGLVRKREDRVLGGVLGAFARRHGWNSFTTRVLGAIVLLATTPLPYIALWILMPRES